MARWELAIVSILAGGFVALVEPRLAGAALVAAGAYALILPEFVRPGDVADDAVR